MADESANGGVRVSTTPAGTDRYHIAASATLSATPADVWALFWDWERFLGVGLPGLTSDFRWLNGGPDSVPSTFQFAVGDSLLKEEIYERTLDRDAGRGRLRYRVLEPALGVLEYDAVFEVTRLPDGQTAFSAVREVRLEPGTTPDALAAMIESETQRIREHFAPQA